MQLTIPQKIPTRVLRYVIAREFGHIMQGRNWKPSDKNKLEINADKIANEWGFPETDSIKKWIYRHRHISKHF